MILQFRRMTSVFLYFSKLVRAALSENADVVIGSRFIEKEGFQSSTMRRFGINYFKLLNKMLVGVTVNDSTSGFRLINRKVLELVSEYYPMNIHVGSYHCLFS